jgi:hypothetical protein
MRSLRGREHASHRRGDDQSAAAQPSQELTPRHIRRHLFGDLSKLLKHESPPLQKRDVEPLAFRPLLIPLVRRSSQRADRTPERYRAGARLAWREGRIGRNDPPNLWTTTRLGVSRLSGKVCSSFLYI